MDLWTTIFAIFRRWYITVPVLIVAVVASFGIASGIKPSYELEGGIWLTTPTPRFFDDGTQVPVQNPLIVNGNVNSGLQIAFGHLGTAATREQFEETGYSPEYELTTNRDAAILQYVITAETEEQANETASALLDETTSVLQERQVAANVDPLDYIGVSQAFNSTPDVIDGGRIRTQATIIILGIVAAAAGALLVDGVAARRKGLAHNEPTMPAAYHPGYQMPMPGPYGYQQPMGNQPMPPQMGPMGPMGQPGAMVPQQPVDPGYTNGNGNGHSAPARPEPEPDDAYDDHSLDALLDDEPEPAPAPARRTNGAARNERPARDHVDDTHDERYEDDADTEIDVRDQDEPRRRAGADASDRRRRPAARGQERRDDDRDDDDPRPRRDPRSRQGRPAEGPDGRERARRSEARDDDHDDEPSERNGQRQGTRPVNRRPAPATRKTRTARSMPTKGGRPSTGKTNSGDNPTKRAGTRNERRNDDGGTAENAAAGRSSTPSADRGVEDHDG